MKILFENDFIQIEMVNDNYPFLNYIKGGAVILPYDKEGNIYLMHTKRDKFGYIYELPRGFVEPTESLEEGALRQLKRKTGFEVSEIHDLGYVQSDTGIAKNQVQIFAVRIDEVDDFIFNETTIKKVDKPTLKSMITDNTIYCNYTLSALMKYFMILC